MKTHMYKYSSAGFYNGLLVALFLGLMVDPAQSETVFQDDFSEADGTVMDNKPADVGSPWSSTSWANQVSGNSFTQIGSGSIESVASFTRPLGSGQTLTATIVTGLNSTFTSGGWVGLTLIPQGGGGSISFGDSGANNKWEETNTGPGTTDPSASNTVTITYEYDTGLWTLETTALPGFATGTATAGLPFQELHLWDDGVGGSAIQYNYITVEMTDATLDGYAAWSNAYGLVTGKYEDQDGDGQGNLYEYGVGGNPTNLTDVGHQPVTWLAQEDETNWLYYVYPRNADTHEVEYTPELAGNLLSNSWAAAGFEVLGTGSNVFAMGFDSVTNRIPVQDYLSRFVRLNIGMSNPLELRGGDISMVPRFEELGGQYMDADVPDDPIRIMMNKGMNFFRVRLFVEPDGAWDGAIQDLPMVTELGKRIKDHGAAFLLDIHYSDTWADPGNQEIPTSWTNEIESAGSLSNKINALAARVETYSSNVVATLKQAGCLPDMVQVGNEITPGFLFPYGKLYGEPLGGWSNFTTLLKAGIRGVKQPLEAGDEMKIMIHIDRGGDSGATQYFYGQLDSYGVAYDVIGLSFYPWWHGTLADLENTLQNAALSFGKEIIVVETAFPWKQAESAMEWPQTQEGQKQFTKDLTEAVSSAPNGLGTGIVWWYPEAVNDVPIGVWYGGKNALFDSDWNALPAMDEF